MHAPCRLRLMSRGAAVYRCSCLSCVDVGGTPLGHHCRVCAATWKNAGKRSLLAMGSKARRQIVCMVCIHWILLGVRLPSPT